MSRRRAAHQRADPRGRCGGRGRCHADADRNFPDRLQRRRRLRSNEREGPIRREPVKPERSTTMKLASFRPIVAPLVAAAVCLVSATHPGAATLTKTRTFEEQLVATAVSAPNDGGDVGGRIDITIERWSTDAERETLWRELRANDPGALLVGLGKVFHRNGVVQLPGAEALGARAHLRRVRNLKYAQKIDTPTGRRIIVVADQHLGFGELGRDFKSWQPEFGLLEIRIGADGTGVGKLARADQVTVNAKTKVLEVADFASEPVRLAGVRSEKN